MDFSRKDFLKLTSLASLAGLSNSNSVSLLTTVKPHPLKKPKPLKAGDTIGVIAPASPVYEKEDFDEALSNLEKLGFNLKLGKHVRDQYGYLAGKDKDRAADLMEAFKDPEIDAIICIRGGWGCNRILPYIDFEVIASHPKFFMGFSDITSLHMAIQKKSGLVTFHGPVGTSDWTMFTTSSFKNTTWFGEKSTYIIPENNESIEIREGKAKGKIIGGNLSVLVAMVGSDYVPSFEGAILFLEDVGESVYRVDRMLTQLKLAGLLDRINGFVFGKCTDCEAGENSLSLKQVFDDHIKPLGIPAFSGAMIGHEEDNITIPIGVEAEIDAKKKTIRLLEAGVS